MSGEKYIGLDVHQATISAAVMDSMGKVVMESILETKASTILEFFAGLRGTLSVTFEEGTSAAWLYDLLKPHVAKLVVCNPRKIALLKHGNKSDKIDARKLADRLRLNDLVSVYHGETGVRMLRELTRSYLTIVKDLSRVPREANMLVEDYLRPAAAKAGILSSHRDESGRLVEDDPRRFGFHNLRHSLASFLVRIRTDPKTVQTLLRHSDVRLTLQFYSHAVSQDRMAAAGEMLIAILSHAADQSGLKAD